LVVEQHQQLLEGSVFHDFCGQALGSLLHHGRPNSPTHSTARAWPFAASPPRIGSAAAAADLISLVGRGGSRMTTGWRPLGGGCNACVQNLAGSSTGPPLRLGSPSCRSIPNSPYLHNGRQYGSAGSLSRRTWLMPSGQRRRFEHLGAVHPVNEASGRRDTASKPRPTFPGTTPADAEWR
jgi:hypothetical protein